MPYKDPEVAKECRKQYYLKNKEKINEKLKEKRLEKGKKEINYSQGKIYKIEPTVEHDENEIYIGSTAMQYLSQRMGYHHNSYKKWKIEKGHKVTSYDLFDKYGFENCDIILLETTTNAKCIDELRAREKHFIKSLKCVNKRIEGRTVKEWQLDNTEKRKEQTKLWSLNNKELRKQITTNYRLKNKDNYFKCDCGADVLCLSKQRHFRTNKHKQLILNNNKDLENV